MDGNCPSKTSECESKIESWMRTIAADGGVARYDDLHVDEIEKRWKQRASWVDAGLEAIAVAVKVRDRLGLDFTVAIACSLVPHEASPVVSFRQPEELKSQIDSSPPSLYLFYRGKEPWTDIDVRTPDFRRVVVEGADDADLRRTGIRYWCYMEFSRAGEFCRSAFALG